MIIIRLFYPEENFSAWNAPRLSFEFLIKRLCSVAFGKISNFFFKTVYSAPDFKANFLLTFLVRNLRKIKLFPPPPPHTRPTNKKIHPHVPAIFQQTLKKWAKGTLQFETRAWMVLCDKECKYSYKGEVDSCSILTLFSPWETTTILWKLMNKKALKAFSCVPCQGMDNFNLKIEFLLLK